MARPPNVSSGQFITDSHINAIKNSVFDWQGDMLANGFSILSPSRMDIAGSGQIGTLGGLTIYENAGSRGASVLLQDTVNSAVAAGGALLFGAPFASQWYAGIKGSARSGSGNGLGDIVFMTRQDSAWSHIQEVMRIEYSGRVGIGTATPESRLHLFAPAAVPVEFQIGNAVTNCRLSALADSSVTLANSANNPVHVYAGGVRRMSINSDGAGRVVVEAGLNVFRPAEDVQIVVSNDPANTYTVGRRGVDGLLTFNGSQSGFSGYVFQVNAGSEAFRIHNDRSISVPAMPTANPGAGTKKLWCDTAAGNVVKFAA